MAKSDPGVGTRFVEGSGRSGSLKGIVRFLLPCECKYPAPDTGNRCLLCNRATQAHGTPTPPARTRRPTDSWLRSSFRTSENSSKTPGI